MFFKNKLKWLLLCCFFFSTPLIAEESVRGIAKIKWKSLFQRDAKTLPTLKKRRSNQKKKLRLRDVKPPSSSLLYYAKGTDEAELESIQNEEINYLFRLLKKQKNSRLFLRLGNLYVEKARFVSFKLQSDYKKKLQDYKKGLRKTKPSLNFRSAENYNRKALKVFQKIKNFYPKHPRMDEVLFFLGFNAYELGLETQGAQHFSELITRFPKSSYVYESQFQLGEYYYIKRNWKKSLFYYSKVATKKKRKFYFFALYKLAWVNYKIGYVSKGLNYLSRIIKESESRNREHVFTFATEAEDDLFLFYTYSRRKPTRAREFFQRLLGAEKAKTHLKKLAYSYRDMGSAKGVLVLFNYLIEEDPRDSKAFEYKHQQIQTLYDVGSTKLIRQSIGEWIRDYGKNSLWAKANSDQKRLVKKSYKLIEITLRDYALRNHQTFRKTRSARAKNLAVYFYKVYFDEFKSDQMTFFYAEILFDSKKYKQAIQKYEEVIRDYPSSKYTETSYRNQILALDKILPSSEAIKALVGDINAPVEFPGEVQGFLKGADRYLKKFPNSENTASILYRTATLYYNFNHFLEASKRFESFSEKYPSSHYMSSVGGVLLDIYNKNKDYKSLEKLANQFIQNKKIDKGLVQEARFILQQLSFKGAQDLAVQKKFDESATLYELFAKKNSSSSLSAVAYFNAGLNYEKIKNYEKAIQMYSSVLLYKNKKYFSIRKQSKESLPVLYEKLCFYRKAAQAYASYAKQFPKSSKVASYWYNAGIIYDAFNSLTPALKAYNAYYLAEKSNSKWEALYFIASLYERNKNWSQAVNYYKRYVRSKSSNSYSLVKSSFKLAEIYKNKLKNKNSARYWYKETTALHRRINAGISYAAQAQFYLAYELYKSFNSLRLPRQSKALAQAVKRKTKLLEELETRLRTVIRYNDGEQIIASLSLTGLAKYSMAKSFYDAPIPKGLDKKGKEQYREGIKKIITPYLQEAAKSYTLALDKSKKFRVYSDWVSVAKNGLDSFVMDGEKFKTFSPSKIKREMLSLYLVDEEDTARTGLVDKLNVKMKYGLSEKELSSLAFATNSRKESRVLAVVSKILNKNPEHKLAINSLAVFYIKNNKPKVGALVLNRLNSKDNPSILNNLGMASLKLGEIRIAISYFKKAVENSSTHAISRINLGNLFIQKEDFFNAYVYLGKAYDLIFDKWGLKDQKTITVLNNYGVALSRLEKWNSALKIFKKLSQHTAPSSKILFNTALILAEGFKDAKSHNEAKGLVNELKLSSNSVRFRRKLDKILKIMESR